LPKAVSTARLVMRRRAANKCTHQACRRRLIEANEDRVASAMKMPPRLRKGMLAAHLTCSVGWLGAVVAYLVLDLTVATSSDAQAVRAAWIAMGQVTSSVLVPLAVASLVTGVVMAIGTKWGLFRHWWVLISLLLTLFAVLVLLSESELIGRVAAMAADPSASDEVLFAVPATLPHSLGGLVVLLVIQVLNVYKPQGLTPYGWRKLQEERRRDLSLGAGVR
jgi:SNF family Na+-dependent transporter